jgi:hypothetical protein
MASASFLSLFMLALAALVFAALITGIVLWATSKRGSGVMSCRSCGYAVQGLTSLNCPECGADLREAGIAQAGSPGRRVTGMVLTLVSGGLIAVMCLLTAFLFVGFSRPSVPSSPTQLQAIPVQKPPMTESSSEIESGDSDDVPEDGLVEPEVEASE